MDHVARFILPLDEALPWAKNELEAGFLINLRSDLAWRRYEMFDLRAKEPVQ
ncbi:hypothetical protein [Shinella zoogloeoides]|uniref:hypothetical protein n=1 Tax=Shinella zoogloeoides TaxID=352475 RepID=UPI00299E83AE|nr:hypothetical protein [Shinella zoogloeoides]